ncbi:MAG: hypothetical protein AAF573_15625 [Bacteroidota bacterium]
MIKRFILLFFCTVISSHIFSQTYKAYVKAGDKAMQQNDYYAAMVYFKNALEIKADAAEVMYKYAEVARQFHSYDAAENYYSKVLTGDRKDEFPLTNFWLGKVKKSQGEYDAAIRYFENYLASGNTISEMATQAKTEIETCRWANELVANPDDAEVTQLNKRVNSPYSEFGAIMNRDTLYFSSYKYKNPKDKNNPPRPLTKVLYSVDGSKGKPIKHKFNDDQLHTAHTAFSRDGKRIYFTQCKFVGKVDIECNICYREKDKKKTDRWAKKIKKLPKTINKEGYTATHPAIGFDAKTGKEILYFVSNRPGGKGKLDIWQSEIDGENFSRPLPVKGINTPQDDLTPFYHEASKTLYFSSDGYQGMGGYDIFKTRKKRNGKWAPPLHTGYPLNSSFNDMYFSLSEDGDTGFFSSNRIGSFYLNRKNKTCCNDIYKVKMGENDFPEEPKMDSLTFTFQVGKDDPPSPPVVQTPRSPQVPTTLEDFLPLALYYDNDQPDRRTRKSYTRKSYEESYLPYVARKYEFIEEFTRPLQEEERLAADLALNDFFDNKVKKGYNHLFLFSQILLKRLNKGDQVEIFLKGYTSPRAKSDYNYFLSKRRISCVRNHFKTYANGVFQPFLASGQLVISERPFGETTAATSISDDLTDQRNSIYSVAASIERRVEIVEIKRSER